MFPSPWLLNGSPAFAGDHNIENEAAGNRDTGGPLSPPSDERKHRALRVLGLDDVAHFYAAAGVPCVPIALNSGLFWPRRRFLRFPGTVRVEILDPIRPGLERDAFFAKLQDEIETATARLIAEGRRG
jgi:1-acyl-sn-glycerol-3-phosphate acyltransferase